MACRKRGVEELGRPQQLLYGDSDSAWYTALEAQKRKPGHGTMLEPQHCDAPRDQQGGGGSPPHAPGESYHA
jgi:hypothetical protein